MGGVDQVDFTKRGGRYTSDFIWNTKWKDQVSLPCAFWRLQASNEASQTNASWVPEAQALDWSHACLIA